MSECDHESSIMRRPWPTGGLLLHGTKIAFLLNETMCSGGKSAQGTLYVKNLDVVGD